MSDASAPPPGRYRATGVFMLRVPALPRAVARELLAAHDPEAYTERALAPVLDVLRVTAPRLADGLARASRPGGGEGRRDRGEERRAWRSAARYLIRMSARPTPFGLLAGVAFGSAGPAGGAASLTISGERLVAARWDSGWLAALARRVPVLGDGLPLVANSSLHSAEGRLWYDALDVPAGRPTSWPLTPQVEAVLRHGRRPLTAAELAERAAADLPGTGPADPTGLTGLTGLTGELRRRGALLVADDVRRTRVRRALLHQAGLERAEAALPTGPRPLSAVLPALVAADVEARRPVPDHPGPALHCDTLVPLDAPATLPPEALELAGTAAESLCSLGTTFGYPDRLTRYAARFTERFGTATEVPVPEVLSPVLGLGPPDGYRDGARGPLTPPSPERDAVLHRLLARAWAEGTHHLLLGDADVAALRRTSGASDDRPLLPALDVFLRLLPPSPAGAPWRAVLGGVGAAPPGRARTRFAALVNEPATAPAAEALTPSTAGGPATVGASEAAPERAPGPLPPPPDGVPQPHTDLSALLPDHLVAELRHPPAGESAANVVPDAAAHPYVVALNLGAGRTDSREIAPAELLLGVHAGRLYLRVAGDRRPLHLVQSSMLDPSGQAPLPRFLMEVADSAFRYAPRFDWGTLEAAAFLPGLEHRGVVLRTAQWRLSAQDVSEAAAGGSFEAALAHWRRTRRVPRQVVLRGADGELPLDLDGVFGPAELRAALDRHGEAVLAEALPADGEALVRDREGRGYAAEVVVPVAAGPVPSAVPYAGDAAPRALRERPPGSRWTSVELDVAPHLMEEVLLDLLAEFCRELASDPQAPADLWFFVRHPAARPHLRVRLRAAAPDGGPDLAARAARWWARRRDGRVTDVRQTVYRREVQRYGGPEPAEGAERLFHADSAAVLRALATPAATRLPRSALTALTLDPVLAALLPDRADRRALAVAMGGPTAGGAEYRRHGARLWPYFAGERDLSAVRAVADGWAGAARWRAEVDRIAPGTAELAVRSLAHLHANRMGLDRPAERTAHGLLRRLYDRGEHTGGPGAP